MTGKDLYKIWAPCDSDAWTRFAKPALFVNYSGLSFSWSTIQTPIIPMDLYKLCSRTTAFIVDLPGASGVEKGLALAKEDFRPVPLYNGVNERNIGGLREIVDNKPIVDALQAGADVLKGFTISEAAPPAFILDYNRHSQPTDTLGMYDNRWSLDFEDMPEAAYMHGMGITRVVLWTIETAHKDLEPILDSYRDMGIEVSIFCDNVGILAQNAMITEENNEESATLPSPPSHQPTAGLKSPISANTTSLPRISDPASSSAITAALRDKIRKFENGRFALMLVVIMAFVNLLFMFVIWESPLLWTTPTIMWLTYLWVPEGVGDAIAIIMTASYLVLYLVCQKKRRLMKAILLLFIIETITLYIYAMHYGFVAFTGYSFIYGLAVFGFPIFVLVFLIPAAMTLGHVQDISDGEYFASLNILDRENHEQRNDLAENDDPFARPMHHGHFRPRRRHFRGFRGYGGYGGGGRGGYSGGGYRGYGGGYGGGFGG